MPSLPELPFKMLEKLRTHTFMADRWRGQRHYDFPSRTQTNTAMVL